MIEGSRKNKIYWKFIDVAELHPLENINDGEQIYSQTHQTEDELSFINFIKQKSIQIQVKSLTFA